jgi:hypothetical protein
MLPNVEQPKKPAIGFIFITLLIDITGWGSMQQL